MSDTIYVAVDTETTGLEPGSRLVELGAVAFLSTGDIVDTFEELVQPDMPMPADMDAFHGITDHDLVRAASASDVLARFHKWLPKGAVLVAHHAPFDVNILGWELDRLGRHWWPNTWLDTLKIARWLDETTDNKLATLVAHHAWLIPPGATALWPMPRPCGTCSCTAGCAVKHMVAKRRFARCTCRRVGGIRGSFRRCWQRSGRPSGRGAAARSSLPRRRQRLEESSWFHSAPQAAE